MDIPEINNLYTLIVALAIITFQIIKIFKVDNKNRDANKNDMAKLMNKQKLNKDVLDKIEEQTRIAANHYSNSLSLGIVKDIVHVMFSNSRHLIYSTVLDWLRTSDLSTLRKVEKKKLQITNLINNLYSNDIEFLNGIQFDGVPLSTVMCDKWRDLVVEKVMKFIDSHVESNNHFDELRTDLKNAFEQIENEFAKKLQP